MSEFKIVVDELANAPREMAFKVPEAWWIAREEAVERVPSPIEEPFSFGISASRAGDNLIFEGVFDGCTGLECSRCGKRYSHALHDDFRLVLSPLADRADRMAGERGEASPDGATDPEGAERLAKTGICLGEDLDSGWYRGPVLQLDDVFGEVIALAMPLQPLCQSECPGVCGHCGAERVFADGVQTDTAAGGVEWVATCDCVDEKVESPFAVLAQLKRDG